MKKPTNKPKEMEEDSDFLDTYVDYTPQKLIDMAHEMLNKGILSISVEVGGYEGWIDVKQKRLETTKEANARYVKELKVYENEKKKKDRKRQETIDEAKKLGMVFPDGKN